MKESAAVMRESCRFVLESCSAVSAVSAAVFGVFAHKRVQSHRTKTNGDSTT